MQQWTGLKFDAQAAMRVAAGIGMAFALVRCNTRAIPWQYPALA